MYGFRSSRVEMAHCSTVKNACTLLNARHDSLTFYLQVDNLDSILPFCYEQLLRQYSFSKNIIQTVIGEKLRKALSY